MRLEVLCHWCVDEARSGSPRDGGACATYRAGVSPEIHANAPLAPTGEPPGSPKPASRSSSGLHVAPWPSGSATISSNAREGLKDRTSRPAQSPFHTPAEVIARIEEVRRDRSWSARRIWQQPNVGRDDEGIYGPWHAPVVNSLRTVGRRLHRLVIPRLRDLTAEREGQRHRPRRIPAHRPEHMVQIDVKTRDRVPDRAAGGPTTVEPWLPTLRRGIVTCLHASMPACNVHHT